MDNMQWRVDTGHRTLVSGHRKVLPRLIFIADGFTRTRVGNVVLDLGRGGVLPWVHLRDHDCDEGEFRRTARGLVDVLRTESPETMVSFNGHADLARELGVGLHIGFRGPGPRRAREIVGPASVFGYSAHAPADLPKSVIAIIDYTIIGPIYGSISKPNLTATGINLVRAEERRAAENQDLQRSSGSGIHVGGLGGCKYTRAQTECQRSPRSCRSLQELSSTGRHALTVHREYVPRHDAELAFPPSRARRRPRRLRRSGRGCDHDPDG